ncbi:MAG TPA: hypothetical protein VH643_21160 [Gemmataceae bacterium]|jgi:hypothetical protein
MGFFVAYIDEQEQIHDDDEVGSNAGYAAFADWAADLGEGEYPALTRLAEEGISDDIDRLEGDLERVLRSKPDRPSEDVLHVARRLLAIVQARPGGALAMVITDGTSGDEGAG